MTDSSEEYEYVNETECDTKYEMTEVYQIQIKDDTIQHINVGSTLTVENLLIYRFTDEDRDCRFVNCIYSKQQLDECNGIYSVVELVIFKKNKEIMRLSYCVEEIKNKKNKYFILSNMEKTIMSFNNHLSKDDILKQLTMCYIEIFS